MAGYNQYGTCPKCKKQILWIKTKAGKNMPCDTGFVHYKESPGGGKDRIVLPDGGIVTGMIVNDPGEADGYGYISHFATCEFAQMFRRKKN